MPPIGWELKVISYARNACQATQSRRSTLQVLQCCLEDEHRTGSKLELFQWLCMALLYLAWCPTGHRCQYAMLVPLCLSHLGCHRDDISGLMPHQVMQMISVIA